jgi:hypothetical protein
LAARKGSMAEANASIEKLGISKKPTFSGPALLLACKRLFIFSSRMPAIMDEKPLKNCPFYQLYCNLGFRTAKFSSIRRFFVNLCRVMQMRVYRF